MLTRDKEWLLYEIVEGLFVASYIKVVENIWQLKEILIFKLKVKIILPLKQKQIIFPLA